MALDDTFISESKKLFQNHHPATHDFVAGTPLPEGEGGLLKQLLSILVWNDEGLSHGKGKPI